MRRGGPLNLTKLNERTGLLGTVERTVSVGGGSAGEGCGRWESVLGCVRPPESTGSRAGRCGIDGFFTGCRLTTGLAVDHTGDT